MFSYRFIPKSCAVFLSLAGNVGTVCGGGIAAPGKAEVHAYFANDSRRHIAGIAACSPKGGKAAVNNVALTLFK